MTSLTLDTKKIESLIFKGLYEEAAEELFKLIENYQIHKDKELIYKSLSYLNLICDKTPSISLKIIKILPIFINEIDSWVRLVALEIMYQISIFRPNLLIDLIEKIRARLYDQEPAIRRLTVKIMGNLILSLHIDLEELQDLIKEYTEKLMDNDWKVKLHVIRTIQKLLNQDYKKIKDLEPLLSMVIINLRDEDDDVARATAELLKIHGAYFLSKEKLFYVLLNLLYNENNRVRELVIWLIGEIGKEKSSEIISIIPKIISFLKEDDYRIQLKVVEALVNIAINNFEQIWANLIHALLETSNPDYRNSLVNAIYHLSENNINYIFPYIFEELENPSENIREGIALVFKRLFEEYQIEIENEIAKILYKLESRYWRERKKTILLLQNICFILQNQKIAVWITIELDTALKYEKDPEVKEEINYVLDNIKKNFNDIDTSIEKIHNELSFFHMKIKTFQRIPAQFREKLNSYINNFKFNETEIQLEKKYKKIHEKINKFHNLINKFEYKRLAFDLIEEWEETKIQIIEELSIIKGFISEICEEKKKEFLSNLESKIKIMEDRIAILKAQFDFLKNYKFEINFDVSESAIKLNDETEKLAHITQIRKNLFKLDGDIREILVNNVEFNEIFKDLLRKWISTKIEIQEYLSDFDREIKQIKDRIVKYFSQIENISDISDEEIINSLDSELGFQLLQSHIHSIISQGIEGFKKIIDNFNNLNLNLDSLIKKNKFSDAKKLIEMNSDQIYNFIQETENQIDRIIGREKIFEDNMLFNTHFRPYIEKFNISKGFLLNRLKYFIERSNDKLYLNQFKHYIKIINPMKLELLSSYVDLDIERVKELILKFIKKNRLNAKIVNNELYSRQIEAEITNSKELLFFKNIKTIGNKIFLNFKLTNPSNFDFQDLQISLKIPSYINFQKKESFPKFLHLNELKPGKVFKFKYILTVDKQKEQKKNLFDPTADEIKLNLYYKGPFDIIRKTSKNINLLLP